MKKYIFPAIVLLSGALAGFFVYNYKLEKQNVYPNLITGFDQSVKIGGEFSLTDQNGAAFSSEKLKGAPSLLYFGFTHCPDFCPAALQVFTEVSDQFESAPINRVFITLDPERDTAEKLKDYVSLYKAGMIALSGTKQETDKVAKQWRVYYSANKKDPNDQDYLVDHSVYSYLLNKNGELVAIFRSEATAAEITRFIKENHLI